MSGRPHAQKFRPSHHMWQSTLPQFFRPPLARLEDCRWDHRAMLRRRHIEQESHQFAQESLLRHIARNLTPRACCTTRAREGHVLTDNCHDRPSQ